MRNLANVVRHGVQQRSRHVFRAEGTRVVGQFGGALNVLCFFAALEIAVASVFSLALGCAFHLVDFAKRGGDVCALESDLIVCLPVDVADEEVDARVVAVLREAEHVVEASRAREEGEETPECTAAQGCSAYALVLSWSRDFDHGYARANVYEEVRVDVWWVGRMGHECHGAIFTVGEDFVGYLVDEEIEAWG